MTNLESFGRHGVGYDSMRPRPSRQLEVRQTRSEDHVSGHSDCTFPPTLAGCLSAVFVFVTLVLYRFLRTSWHDLM